MDCCLFHNLSVSFSWAVVILQHLPFSSMIFMLNFIFVIFCTGLLFLNSCRFRSKYNLWSTKRVSLSKNHEAWTSKGRLYFLTWQEILAVWSGWSIKHGRAGKKYMCTMHTHCFIADPHVWCTMCPCIFLIMIKLYMCISQKLYHEHVTCTSTAKYTCRHVKICMPRKWKEGENCQYQKSQSQFFFLV